jgi:hypothetical protein
MKNENTWVANTLLVGGNFIPSPTFFFLLLGLFSNIDVSDKGCGDVERDWKFVKKVSKWGIVTNY